MRDLSPAPSASWRAPVARLLTAALLAGLTACGGHKGAESPSAASPERQSDAEYDVARDYFYKGQPRVALDHALKAVDLNDESSRALYFVSSIYLYFCSTDQGFASPDCRLADAEKYARAALKADDTFRDAKNLLGQVLILEKKYPEAIEVLTPLTKDPAYAANYLAWGNLGWAQVLSGKVDDGIASLRNSVTQPRFCVGYYRLGVAFEKKGALGDAEASFGNAVSVDSPDCQNLQDAYAERARVRMRMGRAADARADFEKCRDISTNTATGKACAQTLASLGPAPASPAPAATTATPAPNVPSSPSPAPKP